MYRKKQYGQSLTDNGLTHIFLTLGWFISYKHLVETALQILHFDFSPGCRYVVRYFLVMLGSEPRPAGPELARVRSEHCAVGCPASALVNRVLSTFKVGQARPRCSVV